MEARNAINDEAPSDERDHLIEQLREEIRARDEFIAVAAHELRNPMTPIVAQVQLLITRARREGASPALLGGLQTLEFAVDHYVHRATTLLEISRVNAGHLRLDPTTFDLGVVVRECAGKYRQLAAHAGTELTCTADEPVLGHWDRLAVEQVLENLISNAIRYGDGKPVHVEVTADDQSATIRVVDRGVGIPPEHHRKIFERFERADTSRRNGGFGIGLWLAYKLIEAHAGTLQMQSVVGAGSTFTVRLPRDARTHQ